MSNDHNMNIVMITDHHYYSIMLKKPQMFTLLESHRGKMLNIVLD